MELTGEPIPAVARLGNSPDFGVSAFPGSKRSGLGSGRAYETCVVHLDQKLGTSTSVAVRAGMEAALGGEARRRNPFGVYRCYGLPKSAQKGA